MTFLSLSTLFFAGCGTEASLAADPPELSPPDATVNVADTPSPETVESALSNWADNAPVVVILDVVSTEAYAVTSPEAIRTEASLRVVEVLRGNDRISAGETLLVDVAGGQLGDVTAATSEAPLLLADDRVVAKLRGGDDGLTFDGNRSVIPVRDNNAVVCTDPSSEAVQACLALGAALIWSDEGEYFAFADETSEVPLSTVRVSLPSPLVSE